MTLIMHTPKGKYLTFADYPVLALKLAWKLAGTTEEVHYSILKTLRKGKEDHATCLGLLWIIEVEEGKTRVYESDDVAWRAYFNSEYVQAMNHAENRRYYKKKGSK